MGDMVQETQAPFVLTSSAPRVQISLASADLSLEDARALWSQLGQELDRLEHPQPAA